MSDLKEIDGEFYRKDENGNLMKVVNQETPIEQEDSVMEDVSERAVEDEEQSKKEPQGQPITPVHAQENVEEQKANERHVDP